MSVKSRLPLTLSRQKTEIVRQRAAADERGHGARRIERARRAHQDRREAVVRRNIEQRVIGRQIELLRDRHRLDHGALRVPVVRGFEKRFQIRSDREPGGSEQTHAFGLRDQRHQRRRIEGAKCRAERGVRACIRARTRGRARVGRAAVGKHDVRGKAVGRRDVIQGGLVDATAREGAIAPEKSTFLLIRGAGRHVESVLAQVSEAERPRDALEARAALRRVAIRRPELPTPVVPACDEVDDPRNRVGAIDRGRAVLQYLDALDRCQRNAVDVDGHRIAGLADAVWSDAAAVQQHQRALRPETAQRYRGDPPGRRARRRRVRQRPVARRRTDRLQQLLDVDDARLADLLARDHLYRQRRFPFDALDGRAGDFDALELLLLRLRGQGRHRQHPAERDHESRAKLRRSWHVCSCAPRADRIVDEGNRRSFREFLRTCQPPGEPWARRPAGSACTRAAGARAPHARIRSPRGALRASPRLHRRCIRRPRCCA